MDAERTRAAYDLVAADYTELVADILDDLPLDRALLGMAAELAGTGLVLDLGCGSGRITRWLGERGARVEGLDLSPELVRIAREQVPGVRVEVGSLLELPWADAAAEVAVLWYSLTHLDLADQDRALAEVARVVAPGGTVVLAFQCGEDEVVHLTNVYGHATDFSVMRLDAERVESALAGAGFTVTSRTLREPQGGETPQQAYIVATRVASG